MLTAEGIARIIHEANRAYCSVLGDHTIPSWDAAPVWQKESAIAGVKSALADPNKSPEQSHFEWMEFKLKAGWKHGLAKRPEVLEHPCIVSWADLPEDQKVKDRLFLSIVRAFSGAGDPAVVPTVAHETRPDPTEEVGILTASGDVVKGGEIVPEVKLKKKPRREV
jgi:hypothetical protein